MKNEVSHRYRSGTRVLPIWDVKATGTLKKGVLHFLELDNNRSGVAGVFGSSSVAHHHKPTQNAVQHDNGDLRVLNALDPTFAYFCFGTHTDVAALCI